jgi:hypothetical protein
VKSSEITQLSLFQALKLKGWFWENKCFYPPNKTFWFEGDDLVLPNSRDVLSRHYKKRKADLEKTQQIERLRPDKEQFQKLIADMSGLVQTLKELLIEN